MGDEAFGVEEAPAVPASMLSSAWATLLSIGGLVLVLGSLGYAVVQMGAYEDELADLRTRLTEAPEAPIAEAFPEPTATPTTAPGEAPSVTPSAAPTVYVTETAAAVPTRAPPSQPAAGTAGVDQVRQLQAQVVALQQQLRQAQAERDQARKEAAGAEQCQSRLGNAQQLLERAKAVCRAAGALTSPAVPQPQ